ncbi:hypothetical protein ES703_105710 [subsurface metagenome]
MTIKVGLESTQVVLTDVGRTWFSKAYPQGIIYEYDAHGRFRLDAMIVIEGRAVAQIICPLGIPYRIPANIEGQTTFIMAEKKEADS